MIESGDDPRSIVGRLYDAHGAALFRYAAIVLGDPVAAEDAVQQVFSALLTPGAISRIQDPPAYLRRAVRNECYSMLRRRKTEGIDSAAPLLEPIEAASSAPEDRLALERGIRALPPEQREVLHLHVFEGRTFQEIAAASGESINTVASRYRYAVITLREYLSV
jgi:RNA polymerase sigma-70 factor, ECF subfamily